jgi:hypothetical protein
LDFIVFTSKGYGKSRYTLITKEKNVKSGETDGSTSVFVVPEDFIATFGNAFAPVKIFNAIPLPPFSAAANCAC